MNLNRLEGGWEERDWLFFHSHILLFSIFLILLFLHGFISLSILSGSACETWVLHFPSYPCPSVQSSTLYYLCSIWSETDTYGDKHHSQGNSDVLKGIKNNSLLSFHLSQTASKASRKWHNNLICWGVLWK